MLGWLFGKNKDTKPKYQASQMDKDMAFYRALSPAKQELYHLLEEIKQHTSIFDLWKAMVENNDGDLQRILLSEIIPQCPPDLQEKIKRVGKGVAWAVENDIARAGMSTATPAWDVLWLGWFDEQFGDGEALLQFSGEGHLLTVAPTGAGKGQAHIIPTLLDYKGPVVVLDPKGENYRETAWFRRWCGDVYKWAPFDDETDAFNPLDYVETYDDARVLADLLVRSSAQGDPIWDSAAVNLVTGLMLYVKKTREPALQNMREVCRLLAPSEEEYQEFLTSLKEMGDERMLELANRISRLPEKTRESVIFNLDTHLDVWRSDEITRATSETTPGFHPASIFLKQDTGDIYVSMNPDEAGPTIKAFQGQDGAVQHAYVRGHGDSIFIVIPTDKIRTYAGVLRVIIGVILKEFSKVAAETEKETQGERRDITTPTLFLLDELPQLGYMDVIENAIAIARSARIRLWLFAQDLVQLTGTYPKAGSLIANCRTKMFFKPGDPSTAQYISGILGEVTSLTGEKTPLATPQELMGPDYDDKQVVFARGAPPIKSRLRFKYADEELTQFEAQHRAYWEKQPDRKELDGRLSKPSA
tara:strand:+ start:3845 stop:5602 length:1758 start_codon:yes stop_codon:yes gene_type:complete